ncbi:alpha/beta hydrolase [uncultured Hoeflea sp.]|uniref:alpha/beta hydrolase n=1 Tax=uncultured Hoeflea sp. TaxID=538666 RepID=UPI0030D82F26|tara:strand:- start:627 stop:1709 length:1083 start_codon:yes stop_codon:yes gene_type:complete
MSQTEFTANSDILSSLPGPRLALLEASDLARRYRIETSLLATGLERLLARVENRVIERILISRLKTALKQADHLEAAELHIAQMRGGYESGALETLPSFLPQRLSPRNAKYRESKEHSDTHRHASDNRPVILYVAGGGFIMPPSRKQKSMVQRFAEAVNCEVVLMQHRLAPEHPFPAAPMDLAARYMMLLDEGCRPENIFLAADTAGASIVLGALQMLQVEQRRLPAGIVLFSPWCDLSLSGWSYITRSVSSQSPFRMETAAFCARLYLQDEPVTSPLASPVFADQSGWPPILIHTSENDLHFDDAIRMAENGQKQGCDVRINYWDSPRHHLERLSSEAAAQSFGEVNSFINRHWRPGAA